MGLKARKIKTMMESFAEECEGQLNQKLKTQFNFEYNWESLPSDIDSWNWDDQSLKTCFYNSYFFPIETTLAELFQDKMYQDAIIEQVKTIRIEPGRSMVVDYDIEGESLIIKHTMSVNQKKQDFNGSFNSAAANALKKTIDTKLN